MREQIAPFHTDFAIKEISLDLKKTRGEIREGAVLVVCVGSDGWGGGGWVGCCGALQEPIIMSVHSLGKRCPSRAPVATIMTEITVSPDTVMHVN